MLHVLKFFISLHSQKLGLMKIYNNMRMNKLAFVKRFAFTVLSLLIAANLWGQAALSGSGTEESPYKITSVADWNIFAGNTDYWVSNVYIKLENDIPTAAEIAAGTTGVSTMVGTSSNKYSGIFDGDGHTMTLSLSSTSDDAAPFSIVDGANFKNLVLEGNITTNKKYAGSLIGRAYINNVTITNCISKVSITTNTAGDGTHGGFVGELSTNSAKMYFNNCIFEGSITGANTGKVAGFIGYSGGHSYITDCIMAGIISVKENTATFVRTRNSGNQHLTRAYYTTKYNYGVDYGPEGTEAYTNASHEDLNNKIYRQYNDTHFIPSADIAGLEQTVYQYTGSNITITPVVKFYGWTLTPGTDYTVSIEKKNGSGVYVTASDIKDAGDYHYIISGVMNSDGDGDGYGGSHVTEIKVIQLNSWAALVEAMSSSNGTFDLTQSITAENPRTTDLALQVTGNITLNMNGYTIDRHLEDTIVYGQVIRVNGGASLTINGPGTITGGYSWPGTGTIPSQDTYYDKRDGGGIHNMGTLVMNNVTVESNKCEKEAEGSGSYSARGGGIYTGENSSFTMNGGSLYGNTCEGGGGGVFGYKASHFEMNDVTVESNQSGSKGGGLRLQGGKGAASLDNCTFVYNFAIVNDASQGGGIYVDGTALNLTNCTINGNGSNLQGSGLFMMGDCNINAKNCIFSMNGAASPNPNNNGGAIYISKGTFIMDGGSIAENSCNGEGGGIYIVKGATLKLKGNVNITNNHHGTTAGNRVSNVYIADHTVSGKIIIEDGFDGANSKVGVTKRYASGFNGVFTKNLNSNGGSIANFTSDDDGYKIVLSAGEAAIDNPIEWGGPGWPPTGVTVDDDNYTISIPVSVITGAFTANSITLEGDGCLIVENGAVLTVPTITNSDPFRLLIEEGGQVITNSAVDATVVKNIGGSYFGRKNYLISSAVSEPTIYSTNMITINGFGDPSYDLYRYNEAAGLQWENYRNTAHDDFTTLQNGRGYLYLNVDDILIEIEGKLNVSNIDYTLSCSGSELTGFNIIGNPYSHNVYKGAAGSAIPNGDLLEDNYYMLNPTTGEWDLTNDGTVIPPLTGILVQATKAGTLTMTNSTSVASGSKDVEKKSDNIWFTISNNDYEDRACVVFKEGHGLNKIEHLNEEAPMLYIRHNGEDFASVDMNPEAKMFNLNFEAKTMGYYTLSVEPQGEYSYLHLIDKVTEKEIDLLEENEYTFIGSTSDAANRFIVRMSLAEDPEESDNEVFAYQSGDEIVVTGEGELQVFDVMGRFVATYNVSGVQTVTKPITAGVYIVKLNEKTQKIIIK